MINGGVSFWYTDSGRPAYRPSLPGDLSADVCIVGAGLTGLWTAYYLKRARPDLQVVVVEREFAGFGASGRNGGWLSAELATDPRRYGRGDDRSEQLRHAMRDAVTEVMSVAQAEGIEADIVRGGLLYVARSPAQLARLHDGYEQERRTKAVDGLAWLTPDQLDQRVSVAGALGATYSPHAARVQPAKLVRGLAATVERLGVPIYEQTRVREIAPGRARTDHGTVRAPQVLRCLEGFTASIRGQRRTWLPMNSSMVVTEPLSDAAWDQLGWAGSEVLGDVAHAYMYAQRTADGRIALGGRGVPYRYGSRTDPAGVTQRQTVGALTELLFQMFPAAAGTPIAHAWCGVLGVPRDWCASVALDPVTGLGHAGGYVGSGLTTTNLAARTLADLTLGEATELTRLPWVDHRVRRWEPEPLRWLGVHAMYALYRAADRREQASQQSTTSLLGHAADRITGR